MRLYIARFTLSNGCELICLLHAPHMEAAEGLLYVRLGQLHADSESRPLTRPEGVVGPSLAGRRCQSTYERPGRRWPPTA